MALVEVLGVEAVDRAITQEDLVALQEPLLLGIQILLIQIQEPVTVQFLKRR
jgi:hypothetical protein